MKIIILGAGQVGSTVARHLAKVEANDLTVIDLSPKLLHELQDRLDIRTVEGHAAHPDVLDRAGGAHADMILAVTDSDEVNLLACQIAHTLYHTQYKIARVRAAEYMARGDELFFRTGDDEKNRADSNGKEKSKTKERKHGICVDLTFSPENLVTEYIQRLIQYPGALQVLDFADGRVRMVGVKARSDGLLVGEELRNLPEHIPNVDTRVAAIFREGEGMIPNGDTVIQQGDEVFFMAARNDIRVVMSELRRLESTVRRITIAGGGNIGFRLAQALEGTNQVKLIERNPDRARQISEILEKTTVLVADAADEELLLEENIENTDVFCAVTNAEEANILSTMLAKRLGAKKTMALINRTSYVELVESGDIDVAISPQQITIGKLLAYVRKGDVVAVHSLRRGAAEAIEAVAHGDKATSNVVGRSVGEIRIPPGVSISAVVRGEEVIMCHHDTVIHEDDHVILFATDRRQIKEIERLFSVGVGFV